jgi:hypothetical protein
MNDAARPSAPAPSGWHKLPAWLPWVLALALVVGFGRHAGVPVSPSTPGGIIALELPGGRAGALALRSLLAQADATGGVTAADVTRAVLADYGFIPGYVGLLWLVLRASVRARRAGGLAAATRVDRVALLAPWVAGALDVVENLLLLLVVNMEASGILGALASALTTVSLGKWTLLVFVATYLPSLAVPIVRAWWAARLGARSRPGPSLQGPPDSPG